MPHAATSVYENARRVGIGLLIDRHFLGVEPDECIVQGGQSVELRSLFAIFEGVFLVSLQLVRLGETIKIVQHPASSIAEVR